MPAEGIEFVPPVAGIYVFCLKEKRGDISYRVIELMHFFLKKNGKTLGRQRRTIESGPGFKKSAEIRRI
jgi:hypothetical protein